MPKVAAGRQATVKPARSDLGHRGKSGRLLSWAMVRITVTRVPYGYTFLINGRGDVVFDPEWGLATFATREAAQQVAEEVVRVLAEARRGGH